MAKGNLLQGMGRGKIGDIVLSRSNGQQISRVRNRSPKNPKTNAQCYQRAIMATVMQAYSAGKVIFNHSFEGKSVGQGCMSEFLRLNSKMLRQTIATEIDSGTSFDMCYGKVVGPGVKVPVANQYIISRGSLVNNIMGSNGEFINQPIENETIGAWLTRNGFHTDDLLTYVVFAAGNGYTTEDVVADYADGTNSWACNVVCDFLYAQLRVKPSAFTSETAITANTLITDIFDYNTNNSKVNWANLTIGTGFATGYFVGAEDIRGMSGCIRSHENSGLRSNCQMTLIDDQAIDEQHYGLTAPFILDAWKNGTVTVGDSDLILDGGGFNGGTDAPSTLEPLTAELLATFENGDTRDVRLQWSDSQLYQPVVRVTKTAGGFTVALVAAAAAGSSTTQAWASDNWQNVSKVIYNNTDLTAALSAMATGISGTAATNIVEASADDVDPTCSYVVTI